MRMRKKQISFLISSDWSKNLPYDYCFKTHRSPCQLIENQSKKEELVRNAVFLRYSGAGL